jgi:hypothetical protein
MPTGRAIFKGGYPPGVPKLTMTKVDGQRLVIFVLAGRQGPVWTLLGPLTC